MVLVLAPAVLARADRVGPPELYKPVPKKIVAEQPCDATAPAGDRSQLLGKYMCQIGLDGKYFEPYPCEMIHSSAKAGYLRFARYDVYCNVVGTVAKKSLRFTSGSLDCRNDKPDVIGDYAVFDAKLEPIAGGYRLDLSIEHWVDKGFGPDDNRRVESKRTKEQLSVNVCRRAWPKDFKNHNDAYERSKS